MNFENTVQKPWLTAEPHSIWEITGTYPDERGAFCRCLAMVWPYDITDGHVLFSLIAPALTSLGGAEPIAPSQITHARRLVLVHADDPRSTYFAADQDRVTRAAETVR